MDAVSIDLELFGR
ncbi:hypothetical protein JL09_g7015 [Pichia kudriavzevii]|uniref:Uncharacterized protein n=1 Tax=Pichia kudriavzevii TaxID=4909 RepID=A0A099NI62_PICKU|nr:hypothetical protein JL09_g7015 [Pichia kudriavzevii]